MVRTGVGLIGSVGADSGPNQFGVAGRQCRFDLELIDALAEQGLLIDQRSTVCLRTGVVVGAAGVDLGIERVDLRLQIGDLGLQFGAGGDHAVDRLLALHIDVRLHVGVGECGRGLRVAALDADVDDVGVAEAAAGDPGRVFLQPEVLDQPGVDHVALEHRDLVLHQAIRVDVLLAAAEHRLAGRDTDQHVSIGFVRPIPAAARVPRPVRWLR